MAKLRNFFGFISVKLTLAFGALIALTGAAIVVSYLAMNRLEIQFSGIAGKNVPSIRISSQLIETTGALKDHLTSLLLASNDKDLQSSLGDLRSLLEETHATVKRMPAEKSAKFLPLIATAHKTLTAMADARAVEFKQVRIMADQFDSLDQLSSSMSKELTSLGDTAYRDLKAGGSNTITTVDRTLENILSTDAAVQITLKVAAVINLLSGTSIALAESTDPIMHKILVDLTKSGVTRLADLLPKMDPTIILDATRRPLLNALKFFRSIISDNPPYQFEIKSKVMPIRVAAASAISSAMNNVTSSLATASKDASRKNANAIQNLMDKQVLRMRNLSRLRSNMATFVSTALEGVSANDLASYAHEQKVILGIGATLQSIGPVAGKSFQVKLRKALAVADPKSGIIATRKKVFEANARAAKLSRDANSSVRAIAQQATSYQENALTEIVTAGNKMSKEISDALQKMLVIALVSAAVFAISQLLSFVMILRPLKQVTRRTESLANGNLEETSRHTTSGEIGLMFKALNIFREKLLQNEQLKQEEITNAADRQQRMAEQSSVVTVLAEGLKSLATGNLDCHIKTTFNHGYETLRHDFNTAVGALEKVLGSVTKISKNIYSNTESITHAADNLARRTEANTATLEETAASLDELTSAVKSAADGATAANQVMKTAVNDAQKSEAVVQEAVDAMAKIEVSSDKISRIVDVIDDIAFQTNLLALNAGVEAARANDVGNGFAVVATEVRALAQRSSDAAKEINTLITESQVEVMRGVELVDKTGHALQDIVVSVTEISTFMSEIAVSSREQSSGIEEINTAMNQLDQATQQNAAMFEETTTASHSLNHEASELAELMDRFKFDRSVGAHENPQDPTDQKDVSVDPEVYIPTDIVA